MAILWADVDDSPMTPTQIESLVERLAEARERLRQTSIHLPVDLHQRLGKYAFDQQIALSVVMVDAIEAWRGARRVGRLGHFIQRARAFP